ncbi:ComF family protein [Limnobacter sp.]|uniref:ComF family protein n=1 Tax=Limnobacter sp. TaxID=2003368 RepID=UPI0027356BE2|nr:ComF family protein [Limnobacter sp.]MDP3187300.1 ComF family protein [Limnobacter sp.]
MLPKQLIDLFYRTYQGMGDAVLPRRCVACHAGIKNPHANPLARFACSTCMNLFEGMPNVRCKCCGLALGLRPQAFGWTHCRHCKPKAGDNTDQETDCVVCCDYTAPFDQWIAQLKYGKAHGLATFMGLWLGVNTQKAGCALPDLLIPVPGSREKLKQRGYNQAALIAKHAGRHIQRPVYTDWLVKTGEARTQAELGRGERLQNLQGLFRATRPIPAGLRIGLVDDVITTGTTLQSCEAALRNAGAKSILLMAVCRTPE